MEAELYFSGKDAKPNTQEIAGLFNLYGPVFRMSLAGVSENDMTTTVNVSMEYAKYQTARNNANIVCQRMVPFEQRGHVYYSFRLAHGRKKWSRSPWYGFRGGRWKNEEKHAMRGRA